MNLKTIAQKAGVSTATVSNVINGNHHKVSRETIERVQKIIEETNYKPNATARSLVSKKSNIIGVVLPNIAEDQSFSVNPHYAQLLSLLEQYIRNQGYYMMMRCVQKSKEIIPLFSSWNVDGIIFLGTFWGEVEEIKQRLNVPMVFIDTYAEDLGIANVGVDDYKGGWLSAKYLLSKGHRKIAFVTPNISKLDVMQHRYEGFRDACAEAGVEIGNKNTYLANTWYDSGVEAGKRIAAAETAYTAVAVVSDIAAFGVMEGLRMGGKRIPEDVSVIGFDNLLECQYSHPRLTTISQNIEQKASKAGEWLFRMIRKEPMPEAWEKNDVEVVERASVRDLNGEG